MRQHHSQSARAFTLVELLVSILVIGTLMAMLIVGARHAIAYARNAADRQAAVSLRIGTVQFKNDAGFMPPMVRDQYPGAAPDNARVELLGLAQLKKIAVYDLGATDPTVRDRYKSILQRRIGFAGSLPPDATWGTLTDYYDIRYSENTLAYYMLGALDEPYGGTNADISLDGKRGMGMFAPNTDGSFKIPAALADDSGAAVKLPRIYEPYFVPNNSSTKLIVDPSNTQNCQLQDRNGVPVRYYAWIRDDGFRTDPDITKYLRVPRIVGDVTTDTRLRNARFAIVMAGPNKLFGDEPIDQLRQAMGMSSDISEAQARKKAMDDNVVEYGE